MTTRVVLHVGAMKTGTRHVQQVLGRNREVLREAGLLVPRRRSAAVHDLVDYRASGPRHREEVRGRWDALAEEVVASGLPRAVVSHEFLGLAGRRHLDRLLGSLREAEVHVLLTVRDAAATLPAQWQTSARNQGSLTWPEYAEAARRGPAGGGPAHGGHTFLRSQHAGRLLRPWRAALGAERLHVVTVPPPGAARDLLWQRVAAVLGVAGADVDLAVPSNPSTGYASAHLLCLLHQRLALTALPPRQARRALVHLGEAATTRRSEDGAPPLDGATLRFAADWNRRTRRAVRRSGATVTGDWTDLPDTPDLARASALVPPPDALVVAAARAASEALVALAPDGPRGGAVREAVATAREAVDLLAEQVVAVWQAGGLDRLGEGGRSLRGDRGAG